jgi:hypothetical protein
MSAPLKHNSDEEVVGGGDRSFVCLDGRQFSRESAQSAIDKTKRAAKNRLEEF